MTRSTLVAGALACTICKVTSCFGLFATGECELTEVKRCLCFARFGVACRCLARLSHNEFCSLFAEKCINKNTRPLRTVL
jgi:hypothetical protein